MTGRGRADRLFAAGAWGVLGMVACVGLLLVLSLDATTLVRNCVEAFTYRFELDYGEGPIFDQTRRLMAGERIYRAIERPPC
jgi:hypothetical protein